MSRRKHNFPEVAEASPFVINSIRGSQSVGYRIDLAKFKEETPGTKDYIATSVHYQYTEAIHVIIFSGGSVIVVGAPTVEETQRVAAHMCNLLESYRLV